MKRNYIMKLKAKEMKGHEKKWKEMKGKEMKGNGRKSSHLEHLGLLEGSWLLAALHQCMWHWYLN